MKYLLIAIIILALSVLFLPSILYVSKRDSIEKIIADGKLYNPEDDKINPIEKSRLHMCYEASKPCIILKSMAFLVRDK